MVPGVEASIRKIADGLQQDPRIEKIEKAGGKEGPREFLFTQRVVAWIGRLALQPSDALLLAAWGHVFHRWNLPRETYPKTTAGYHKWRRAQAVLSADETEKILRQEGVAEETVRKVRDLILKTNFPQDAESQHLEDADCLAFLELKFDQYISEWDEDKTIRILKGTLEKMSAAAQRQALTLAHSPEAERLLKKALAG